jgi:hypothetical protein
VKRAKEVALVDSGATENFMNLQYAQWLRLPIKWLAYNWNLYNVDGTENKSGKLKYYTDLEVQTGNNQMRMWFILTDLGEHKAILGYMWFVAVQPKINWKSSWIDESHLPIIFRMDNVGKAKYMLQTINVPWSIHEPQYCLRKVAIGSATNDELKGVLQEYERHSKVFSKKASQWLPSHMVWNHAIELLPGAPSTLPRWLLLLTQEKIEEARKFIKEHLEWKTIWPSWSSYAANFFFVKRKDRKLRLIQDYQPLNKWTKKNWNVSPLIPLIINQLAGCTLFMKFDIWWGYNNTVSQKTVQMFWWFNLKSLYLHGNIMKCYNFKCIGKPWI